MITITDYDDGYYEGTGLIPGPIIQLHATAISDNSVTLVWQPPAEGSVDRFVVHYTMAEAGVATSTTFELDQQINVTESVAVIGGLKSNQFYNFFVLSANEHGTSLPSSILTINVTNEGTHLFIILATLGVRLG